MAGQNSLKSAIDTKNENDSLKQNSDFKGDNAHVSAGGDKANLNPFINPQ